MCPLIGKIDFHIAEYFWSKLLILIIEINIYDIEIDNHCPVKKIELF